MIYLEIEFATEMQASIFHEAKQEFTFTPFCFSVSGEVPEFPVVSLVSGCVFERRLLEKYVHENGTDPTNGEPLKTEQIIEIKVA